ncbi:MAG: PAS domain S-box protein, partial [Deltaproteobacteria bacterium]|nr:PAS domain S-box protein [Deltaproteobacteria bacterium]
MVSRSKTKSKNTKHSEKGEHLYKLYKNVVENLKEGIWIGEKKNKTFSTLYWNKGAERISGFKKPYLKGRILLKIVPGLKQVLEEIANNSNGKKSSRINIERYEYNHAKNSKHPLYLTIQAYFLSEEKMVVIIFEDITEKAKMEK